jgi:TonB family protein
VHEADPLRNEAARANETGGANQGDSATSGPEAAILRPWKDGRPLLLFHRQAVLPVFVGIAVLVLAVSLWRRVDRSAGDILMHPVNASSVSAEGAANTAFPSVAQGAAVSGLRIGTVSTTQGASVGGEHANSSAPRYGYGDREVRQAAGGVIQLHKKSAQISSKSSLPLPMSYAAHVKTSAVMETDASEMMASPDPTYDLSSEPLSNRLVTVSSGVMAANLVSGPKPSYPALASLTRTQGDVVIQAVISKKGTVEHLHVIKGHRLLRGAAKSAVRTWRYRPYKIDGVPVDVATIVSVDFSLHR